MRSLATGVQAAGKRAATPRREALLVHRGTSGGLWRRLMSGSLGTLAAMAADDHASGQCRMPMGGKSSSALPVTGLGAARTIGVSSSQTTDLPRLRGVAG